MYALVYYAFSLFLLLQYFTDTHSFIHSAPTKPAPTMHLKLIMLLCNAPAKILPNIIMPKLDVPHYHC